MSESPPEKLKQAVETKLAAKNPNVQQTSALGAIAQSPTALSQVTQTAFQTAYQPATGLTLLKISRERADRYRRWADTFHRYGVDIEQAFSRSPSWEQFETLMVTLTELVDKPPLGFNAKAELTKRVAAYLQGNPSSKPLAKSSAPAWGPGASTKAPTPKIKAQNRSAPKTSEPRFPLVAGVKDSATKHFKDLAGHATTQELPTNSQALVAYVVGHGADFGYVDDGKAKPRWAYHIGDCQTKMAGGVDLRPWSILVSPTGEIFHYGPTGTEVPY